MTHNSLSVIFFATLFLILRFARADWNPPFFIAVRNDTSINADGNNFVEIAMNEEIIAPFALCYLNDYIGDDSPTISGFSLGQSEDLGIRFEKDGTLWNMVVTKTQDYENQRNRNYLLEVVINQVSVTVSIVVRNIFDNPPTVEYQNPCSIPELEGDYTSQCSFKVTDVDGMTNNSIRFEIQGNFNESDLFSFKLDESLSTELSQTYYLFVNKPLDYDERSFYSFRVTVYDAGNNYFTFNTIIEVEDVPNKPPRWVRAFTSDQFPEKQEKNFEARAVDGDAGINAEICYSVGFEEGKNFSDLISINRTTGDIHVEPINRDLMKMEVYPFYITAYECEDSSSFINNSAVLLVDDINDNFPNISFDSSKNVIEIYEETFNTLFSLDELNINDIDLGVNAMYDVKLDPEKFGSAFNIIPASGYQLQGFTISVLNASMLDYEVEEFQKFNISIIATETYESTHTTEKIFEVRLLNWNDELPKFEEDEYVFNVDETVTANYLIGQVKATDRDIDDSIEYYLNANLADKFTINSTTGEIRTVLNRTFIYEQQSEFSFQVFAKDTLQTRGEPIHTTSTQVVIKVIDINDTPPTIILPRKILRVTENDSLEVITDEIEIYDPDTSANLTVFIDWTLSTATGLNILPEYYENCVDLTTAGVTNNRLHATLTSSSTNIIDYEKFQVLFLTITAIDSNTEINENSTSAVLTVFISDVNDNAPEFMNNTLEVRRTVTEASVSDVFIGFIHAFDIDGPGNNDITFILVPRELDTDDWIKIDSKSGELIVGTNNSIDCDVPKRFTIEYEIVISDGTFETRGNLSIIINDINNKIPELETPPVDTEFKIYENASDIVITNIKANDLDRDDPHNVIQYSLNYQSNPELQRFFSVNLTTGELRVKELDEFNRLDRDTEPSEYSVSIYIEDNLGIGARNGFYTTVKIKLLDVNDNAPQMPPNLDFSIGTIDETLAKTTTIVEQFYAPDIDDGLNGEVLYEIISIIPVTIDRELNESAYQNLFILENYQNKYARIKAGNDFREFSGTWSIKILAVDRGNETEEGLSQSSEESYEIKINPYNFRVPEIINPPRDNMVLRLDFGAAIIGRPLVLLNESNLYPFEAKDDDAGIFGDVTFSIEPVLDSKFEFLKIDKKFSELRLKSSIEEIVYNISIVVTDGGNLTSRMSVSLAFVDKTTQPYFENNMWTTVFTENQTGLEELRLVPEAKDRKNIGIQSDELEFEVYYYIDETYNQHDAEYFTLDKSTRTLRLSKMLDRETNERHSIRIFASNEEIAPPIRFVSEESMLYIEITVDDVNDNPPSFVYKQYAVGISEKDNFGKNLLTLEATDPDLDDKITYFILTDTIRVSNDELNSVKNSAFAIDQNTGVLSLNFEVQSTMSGFFEFDVQARDLVNHTDTVYVKIYIIAENNRVNFDFENTIEDVRAVNQERLKDILSNAYESECVIDEILPLQTSDVAEARLRVHFVKDNEAIEAAEINSRSTDLTFISELATTLSRELSLKLKGIPSSNTNDEDKKSSNLILEIILAVISSILFVLLVIVTIIFFILRNNYNREIKALSEKKIDLDPKKIHNVKALPNTNIYSGQNNQFNPVMNKNLDGNIDDADKKSINSEYSDDFRDLENNNRIFNVIPRNDRENDTSNA